MTIYDPFDIVVVSFPFTDRAKQKPRPALAISSRSFNASQDHVILLMITTAANTRWPTDVAITDLETAGLPAPSAVRFKCFTLDGSLIARRIGSLGHQDKTTVKNRVCEILDLTENGGGH